MRLLIALLVALPFVSHGQDAALTDIRAILTPLRTKQSQEPKVRGAGPELTVVKHRLRDWVESRVTVLKPKGDVGALQRQLNAELDQAGLFSVETPGEPTESLLGLLGDIELEIQQGL